MPQAQEAAALPKPAEQARAFLSHSSVDKTFVITAARQLGRARVRFDLWEFAAGMKLTEAIRSALSGSALFVFFASRASIDSLWAKFETDEAEELVRSEALKGALVLIIDGKTRPADLPKWMQRALIESVTSSSAARRLVEYHLNRLRGVERQTLFIGRERQLAEFSEKLIPAPESTPPRILIVGGLPGVGRKTFLERGVRDFLSLRSGPVLTLRPTDGLDALHLALLDELGALDTKVEIAAAVEQFQRSNLKEKADAIAQMLASSSLGNVAPIISDEGSLIDSSGKYTDEALALFEALKKFPDTVVGVVHTRRPTIGDAELSAVHGFYTRVPPLDRDATVLLINQTLRRAGIQAETDQIAELASYIEGYPPAVNLAVALAQQYGLATVMADKSGLVDFQFRTFAGIIEKLKLRGSEWEILRILAAEAVLPFETLAAVIRKTDGQTASALRRLIDLNLVLSNGDCFQIAFPVKFAVQSLNGRLTSADFSAIAGHLKSTFWDPSDLIPPFQVIQATIHAVMRSDNPDLADFRGFAFLLCCSA